MYDSLTLKLNILWAVVIVIVVGMIIGYQWRLAEIEGAMMPQDPNRYLRQILMRCRSPGGSQEMEMCRTFLQKIEKLP